MKKIILTGGGTAGHVTPNIALIPKLKEAGFEILYVGSYEGIEKKLIENEGIPYRGISSGKLRRYFDLKNFSDPFRVLKGFREASKIIKEFQPDIVFSKGGYVAVPVVRAAGLKKIPVVIHESDMTPGLANKLSYSAAAKICCNFPETLQYLPEDKAVLTGSPIRAELLSGNAERGRGITGLPADRPVILVIGGSLGSKVVNEAVRAALPELLKEYSVLHLCGKGNLDASLEGTEGYRQYEYVSADLKDMFALADLMISRAGANSICEILALRKPNVLIPLSAKASRGDQILNARSFENQGFSCVLEEEELTAETLLQAVKSTFGDRGTYIAAMEKSTAGNGVEAVMKLILELTGGAEDNADDAGQSAGEEAGPENAAAADGEAAADKGAADDTGEAAGDEAAEDAGTGGEAAAHEGAADDAGAPEGDRG